MTSPLMCECESVKVCGTLDGYVCVSIDQGGLISMALFDNEITLFKAHPTSALLKESPKP